MSQDPRGRITEGITRGRLQSEGRRARKPTALFAVGIIATCFACVYVLSNLSTTFGHDTYQVRFAVDQDFGVFAGVDEVRFRGVPAGTISKVERSGSRLILLVKIRKDRGVVYRNARAQIRPITPLNDVYLDIVDPGTSSAGRADPSTALPEAQTLTSVTVPDVLNVFQPNVRRSTHVLLDQLGNGMADGGARLRQAFIDLGPFLAQTGELTHQIARRKAVTGRLIHNTAVLTTELGRRETELRRLVTTGAATVGTLGSGSHDLDATLAELGPTFTELRTSLASVRGVVGDVDRGLVSLNPVAERASEALASLRQLNTSLSPAVAALQAPVRQLVPWVGQLDRVVNRLPSIAAAVRPQTATVDRLAQRLVDCKDGIIGFFQWDASLAKFGDQNGPVPRGNLVIGVPAVGGPGQVLRTPETACAPGPVVRGVPTEKDKH